MEVRLLLRGLAERRWLPISENIDSIGECDNCDSPIGHGQLFVFIQRGYNCHGSMMKPEDEEDKLYHADCVEIEETDDGGKGTLF
jgi:hypothetical protein